MGRETIERFYKAFAELDAKTMAACYAPDASFEDPVFQLRGRNRDVIRACKRYIRAIGTLPADARSAFALVEQTRFAMNNH